MVALAVAFGVYTRSERRIDQANELRLRSFLLADELRQSSDDLTRMVRTYVVTGDPSYARDYLVILDIREGRSPRPEGYERMYWDLKETDRSAPHTVGPRSIPLLELMKQNDFPEEEMRKLAEAKTQSDKLAELEMEAMRVANLEGPETAENRESALAMLHDRRYHQAKAAIMKPINECYGMMDRRTQQLVLRAERNAAIFRYIFIALGIWLTILLWRVHAVLQHTLGGSVDVVFKSIAELGSGDFSKQLPVLANRRDSVMGWLAETQAKLRQLDAAEKQAGLILRESEERFRAIANYAASWECWFNQEGKLLWMNPYAEPLTGYTVDEFMAAPDVLSMVVAPDDLALAREAFQKALKGGQGESQEFRVIRKDGSTLWLSVAWRQMLDAGGQPIGLRTSGQDISERKRAEAEREKMQGSMQRTQRLELVGQLAGGVAHEFNNKLQAILGFTELLNLEIGAEARLRGYLAEIRKAAQQSAKISTELLGFARKQLVAPQVLDLNVAISNALAMLEQLVHKPVKLDWQPGPGLWAVCLDPAQLVQILGNLVINARDAISGEGRITITTQNLTHRVLTKSDPEGMGAGDYVLLSVMDNGQGMEEDVMAHLFEPFFTTKEVGKGSGLGLATVYGIIKQNHGYISVQSELHRGTTFRLFVPRVR